MIHVIAILTAKPGKREEVLAAFRANMAAVHAEQGCIEYGPASDAEGGPGAKYGADTFVVGSALFRHPGGIAACVGQFNGPWDNT